MSRSVGGILVVWAILMAGTAAATWGFSAPEIDPTNSTLAVMIISAIKVALVMAFFMELKAAPVSWQLAASTWLGITTAIVVGLYL